MSPSEYQQLIEFLGPRFEAIDRRFEALEHRIETGFREIYRHFETIYARLERLEQEYQTIVEGLRRIEALLAHEIARRELLERRVDELKTQMGALEARIEAVERHIRG